MGVGLAGLEFDDFRLNSVSAARVDRRLDLLGWKEERGGRMRLLRLASKGVISLSDRGLRLWLWVESGGGIKYIVSHINCIIQTLHSYF